VACIFLYEDEGDEDKMKLLRRERMPNKLKLQNKNEGTGKTHVYEASWGWWSVEAENEYGDVDESKRGE
jgi:hypothetical protein